MKRNVLRVASQLSAAGLCGAVLVLGACKKEGSANGAGDTTMSANANPDTSAAARTGSSTSVNAPATAPAAPQPMTDAQIFAKLAAANTGEIAAAKIAESKATNTDVKAFARQMITDHTKLLNDGNALAKRLKITPDTTAAAAIMSDNSSLAGQLHAAPKGKTFDTTYVNAQVTGHQGALDMIKTAQTQAQNADLRQALSNAEPMVQHHLDQIKSIQGKLQ